MVENNPEKNQQRYPYRVVTDSAVLYLSRDDIELLGEEKFYAGLELLLAGMEKDFAEPGWQPTLRLGQGRAGAGGPF